MAAGEQHGARSLGDALMYALMSALMLFVNKALLVAYPFPSTALLLQLLASAAASWAAGHAGLAHIQQLDSHQMLSITPLAGSFFVVLWSSANALAALDLDALVALKAAAPVALLLADWLFLHGPAPSAKATGAAAAALLAAAGAFGPQLHAASPGALLWLLAWFVATTFHAAYGAFVGRSLRLEPGAIAFYENWLAAAPALVAAAALDLSSPAVFTGLADGRAASLLGLACVNGFVMSWAGWGLRQPPPSSSSSSSGGAAGGVALALPGGGSALVGFGTLSVAAKALSVLINAASWERHGPLGSQLLLLLAIAAGAAVAAAHGQAQQQGGGQQAGLKQQQQPHGGRAGRNPLHYVGAVSAVAASVAALVWTGAALGHGLDHHSLAFAHSGLEVELQQLRNHTYGLEQRVEQRLESFAAQHRLSLPHVGGGGGSAAGSSSSSSSSSSEAGGSSNSSSSSSDGSSSSSGSSSGSRSTGGGADTSSKGGGGISSSSKGGGGADAGSSDGSGGVSAAYVARVREAASKPFNIAVMTGVFWTFDAAKTANCTLHGVKLDCRFHTSPTPQQVQEADLLYYHVPSHGGKPRDKAFPNQLRLAMSLESSAYYGNLDSPHYMCHFDAEMTYRTCAQVTNWYSLESFADLYGMPVTPFEQKVHGLAYINSNCGAQSGRSDIMRALMKLNGSVPVHSMGRCDTNKPWPGGNKRQVFNKYKFCVTMENSLRHDYVTEKMWDGLAAGCVPIYMGSASARQFAPDGRALIIYDPKGGGDAATPAELDALMHRIGSDKAAYEAMLAWKAVPPADAPSPLFRYLWSVQHTSGECFLCQFLARHRVDPRPRYTTCLFNETWMQAAGQTLGDMSKCT